MTEITPSSHLAPNSSPPVAPPAGVKCSPSLAVATSLPLDTPDNSSSPLSSSKSTLVDIAGLKCPQLSTLRLLAAHIGAALTLFLATTDATIVSTILPTISSQFSASQLEYTWVGVSYMLTQTAFQPLYGKLSDLIGRKLVLYISMLIFVIGSMLCGSAQSMLWLILARALAGIGGGGIVSLVWTITSEIVEVRSRAKWSQALSVTWSCSAIAGPLLGGAFSGNTGLLNWRWAFYLNLPMCLLAFLVLWFSLRDIEVGFPHLRSWKLFCHTFDFIGLLLFMTGSGCIIVGFSFASSYGWLAATTLSLIVGGLAVLVTGGFYEAKTRRQALFPATSFQSLTTVVILIINFLHNFAFNAGTFYLALYFQSVKGASPLFAGLEMLPYSLGSSLASMPTAWFIGYWQRRTADTRGQNLMISLGLGISTIGFGLMIRLNQGTSQALQIIFPFISGLGLGMLFHAPYQVFTKTLRPREIASGTSAFFLVRFTGATVGLSVAGAIFHSRLSHALPSAVSPSLDLEHLNLIQPSELRNLVLHAVSSSIQAIWAVCCPSIGVAFLISILLRNLSYEDEIRTSEEKTFSSSQAQSTAFSTEQEKMSV